jgi:hypothetical protein
MIIRRRATRWLAATVTAAGALTGAAYTAGAPAGAATAAIIATHPLTAVSNAQAATLPHTTLPHTQISNGAITSSNWAGYADQTCATCALRYVQSQFTVPSVNCVTTPDAYVSHWVGLDGLTDGTVEQTGILAECSGGTPSYYAFYEMYPSAAEYFSGVSAGDSLTTSVYYNGSQYQVGLTDTTINGALNETLPCPSGNTCSNTSAEVITEAPYNGGVLPLADFSIANFTNSAVTSRAGLHGTLATQSGYWTSDPVTQVGATSTVLDSPSALEGGQAFFNTWKAES